MQETKGDPTPRTRIIRGTKGEICDFLQLFFQNAASNPDGSQLKLIADKTGLTTIMDELSPETRKLFSKDNFETMYLITDIQPETLDHVKLCEQSGFQVRHIEGIKRKLAISRKECIESIGFSDGIPEELIWSDKLDHVAQLSNEFDILWDSGIPAEPRIQQLVPERQPRSTRDNPFADDLSPPQNRKNRNRIEIISKMLEIAERPVPKSHLMYKGNICYSQVNELMDYLQENGLIAENEKSGKTRPTYLTTEKGRKYIQIYRYLENLGTK